MAVVDRPQEGSRRQVLKRPGWLMAQRICWESERRWEQEAPVPQQPLPCHWRAPCLFTIYLSQSSVAAPTPAATCCRLRHAVSHVLGHFLSLSHSHSHFTLLALYLFPSHHTHFLLPCVRCDMNATAAPFLIRSWPLLCIPLPSLL